MDLYHKLVKSYLHRFYQQNVQSPSMQSVPCPRPHLMPLVLYLFLQAILASNSTIQKSHKCIPNLVRCQPTLLLTMTMTNISPIQTNPLSAHPLHFRRSENATRTGQFIRGSSHRDVRGNKNRDGTLRYIYRDTVGVLALRQSHLGGGIGLREGADCVDDGCCAFLHCV